MANKNKSAGLEIQEDMEFQGKEWAFERVGRWFILLVILAALAGLFGWGKGCAALFAATAQVEIEATGEAVGALFVCLVSQSC